MSQQHPHSDGWSWGFVLVSLLAVTAITAAAAGLMGCAARRAPDTPPGTRAPSASVLRRPQPPTDEEFRALFVTTAYNRDWPSEPGLPASVQQDEIAAIVERAKALNCNAVLLQVRAFGDRIYYKQILDPNRYYEEPWAMSLNFGKPPGYDPLQFWINTCSAAGLELHFWVNPFRVNNLVKIRNPKQGEPDLYLPVKVKDKQLWLDPDNSYVRQYVKDVVAGLMQHYGKHPEVTFDVRVTKGDRIRAEEGGDGTIYDHYIPEEGKKRLTKVECASTQPVGDTEAEQRVNWLLKKYVCVIPDAQKVAVVLPNPPEGTFEEKMYAFIADSARIVRRQGRFGYTPDDEGTHARWAQRWLTDGLLDYAIPELYLQRFDPANPGPNEFRRRLEVWLSAIPTTNPATSPFVPAGLQTLRVQTPAPGQPPWRESEIRAQMADVRAARGANGQRAAGEAHYSASALRTSNEGGPRPDNNLVPKLKGPGGHYERPGVIPDSRLGERPGSPTVESDLSREGWVVWRPAPHPPDPDHWIVWVWRGNQPAKARRFDLDRRDYQLRPGEDAVWVKAVSKHHRHSDFGKYPPEP